MLRGLFLFCGAFHKISGDFFYSAGIKTTSRFFTFLISERYGAVRSPRARNVCTFSLKPFSCHLKHARDVALEPTQRAHSLVHDSARVSATRKHGREYGRDPPRKVAKSFAPKRKCALCLVLEAVSRVEPNPVRCSKLRRCVASFEVACAAQRSLAVRGDVPGENKGSFAGPGAVSNAPVRARVTAMGWCCGEAGTQVHGWAKAGVNVAKLEVKGL